MLSKEDYAVIKSLYQRGVYLKDIAVELEVHPRTVKRALQRGGAPKPERKHKSSKLDAYKAKVDELLANDVWNVMVILREIQQLGYSGGQSISLLTRHDTRMKHQRASLRAPHRSITHGVWLRCRRQYQWPDTQP